MAPDSGENFPNPSLPSEVEIMNSCRPPVRRAVTLLEVLVVIATAAVLFGLLLPAILSVREAAQIAQCQNNLHQLGISFHSYEADVGKMPPYTTGYPPGTPHGNWLSYLLPYLDAEVIAQHHVPAPPPCPTCPQTKIQGSALTKEQLSFLTCPSDPSANLDTYWGTTNYLANWYALSGGAGGYFAPARRLDTLTNGLSNTVVFAEGYKVCDNLVRMSLTAIWYHNFGITQQGKPSDDPVYLPNDYTMFQAKPTPLAGPNACDKWRTQTPHPAMNVCLADGSVRSVSAGISPLTWKQVLKSGQQAPPGNDW
jgi:competence protein ComGC